MIVRPVEDRDVAALPALWQAVGLTARVGDFAAEIAAKRQRDPELFLVAEDDGAVVGSVMGGYDGRRGYVYRMAVAAGHRRRGVASALIVELEGRFAKLGVHKVNLLAYRGNDPARRFWTALGYAEDTVTVPHHKFLGEP